DPRVPVRTAMGDRGRGGLRSERVTEPRSGARGGRIDASPVDPDVRAILLAQEPNGAFPASAGFSQYGHCWLRDGAFIGHAADLAGLHANAERFHDWVASSVSTHDDTVRE